MISSFFSKILGKFEAILAQSEIDCQRYRFFSAKNTLLMDNLKYANDPLPCKENLLKFFQKKCAGKKVFVAASTHEKEEDAIIDAHKMLRQKFDLVTVIIPRHTARIGDVCMVFEKHGVDYLLRSSIGDEQIAAALNSFDENIEQRQGIPNVLHDTKEIYCIDTFGEVGTFFRLADICFVGGSLVPIGGHNILEPVILGKPVLHGQFMDNAIEIRDFLKANKVAFEVHNANEIYNICLKLLTNPDELAEISKNALSISRNRALEQIDSMMRLQRFF
jgi:3-deoxy-D-manno-octulosonic-acid transferase